MNIVKVLIEFLITFIILFGIYYFFIIRKCKNKKDYVSQEVNLILVVYRINYHNINVKQMCYLVSIVTALVLASAITFISYWNSNLIVALLLATLVSLLCLFIIYSFIGKYYLKKSKEEEKKIANKKKSKNYVKKKNYQHGKTKVVEKKKKVKSEKNK